MTASELSALYLDDSAYQVAKVFEGLDEAHADVKVSDGAMSPRETLIHLTDCVYAAQSSLAGESEYAWGSYKPADTAMATLMNTFNDERGKAVEAVKAAGDDEKALKAAAAFIAGHEFYHVGQMASLRLKVTPDWDAYSIYR